MDTDLTSFSSGERKRAGRFRAEITPVASTSWRGVDFSRFFIPTMDGPMSQPTEFFDRHTRSFILLCFVAGAIAYGICNWLGWDQPGQALVVLLLAELLFVSLGVLAMLFAENWFEELDASSSNWAPVAKRGNPKTAFLKRPARGVKFDRTGDYLRMVAGEMQPGTDGSYFGSAAATPKARGKGPVPMAAAVGAQPVPRSLAEALQIHRPAARSAMADYVPPPPPMPQAPPVSAVAPSLRAAIEPAAPVAYAPPPPLFVAPAAAAAPPPLPAVPAASPVRPAAPSPPPLPPTARAPSGPGPVVALGTPAGQGAMRPKPPRQRPS